jgi:antitoxin VapB
MAERAKIFNNGGSQAVRLPKAFRFPDGQREVSVRRVGRKVILEPVDEWPPEVLAVLGSIEEEIPRPESEDIATLKDPFE